MVLVGGDARSAARGDRRARVARRRPGGAPADRAAIRLAGHVTVPKGGRSRRLPMTQRLTAALKAARHLRGERVLCLPDGTPITRDRVIKAIRGAQRVAADRAGRAHPAAHVLFAPGDEGGARAGHPGARRPRGSVDDAALHAPESGGNGRRDPIAGRTTDRPRTRGKIWRHSGHARGERRKLMERKELVERATGIEPV